MTDNILLYKYRWNVIFTFSSLEQKLNPDSFASLMKIRVKPETEKDLFPMLTQKYIMRPIFRKISVDYVYESNKYCSVWFIDVKMIKDIFKRFYMSHHDTPADVFIQINCQNKIYKLAIYRQGLKEPVVIPESAYQLIVFKNKFEDYRSDNYDQPRGAWIW